MNFHVMTLFPEMVEGALSTSITGRAIAKGLFSLDTYNIRDYTLDKHGKTEDYIYGGGSGLLMQVQPVYDCYKGVMENIRNRRASEDAAVKAASEEGAAEPVHRKPRVLYMSPQGRTFSQKMAEELSQEEDIVFLCGHYEGVDERALMLMECECVSIGDYVLTGGELPAIIMIDAISRLIKGVLHADDSAEIETFHDGLLEFPQYSRPEVYEGLRVPEILLSGHHAKVEEWRRQQSIERTLKHRPDLIDESRLTKKELKYLLDIKATM